MYGIHFLFSFSSVVIRGAVSRQYVGLFFRIMTRKSPITLLNPQMKRPFLIGIEKTEDKSEFLPFQCDSHYCIKINYFSAYPTEKHSTNRST